MLNKFFASYAEYTFRTKLSEAQLRTALKQECGHFFINWEKYLGASRHKKKTIPFYRLSSRKETTLRPVCPGRNFARGEVHLSLENAPSSNETIRHVSSYPPNIRWFPVVWLGFLFVWTIGVFCTGKRMMLIPVPIMLGAFFLILHLCRGMAENEIPLIRHSFDSLIKHLEKAKNDTTQCNQSF